MSSPENDNERRFGSIDEVYAVGAVIVAWNLCEGAFAQLLLRTLRVEWQTAQRTFQLLGNQSRVDLLRLEGRRTLPADEFDRLDSCLTAYSICLENRNLVAHSQINMNAKDGGLSLQKPSTKDRLTMSLYRVPTADMMGVANTIFDLSQHAFRLSLAIWAGPSRRLGLSNGQYVLAPLPDKFPRPRKLSPLPPEDPPASQPPPQSSQASPQ